MDEIPYYVYDSETEQSHHVTSDSEAYIDDGELRELLIELLGEDIPEHEIQKILKAASDENISEDDFDKMVDEFILKNKS